MTQTHQRQASHDQLVPARLEYFPWHFCKADLKPAINAMVNIHLVWCDVVFGAREPNVARLKLAWWREELSRMENGEGVHPLTKDLRFTNAVVQPLHLALLQHDANLDGGAEAATPTAGVYVQLAIAALQSSVDVDQPLHNFCDALGTAWDHALAAQTLRSWTPNQQRVQTLGKQLEAHALQPPHRREQRFGMQHSALLRLWLDKAREQGKLPTLPAWRTLFASWRAVTQCR